VLLVAFGCTSDYVESDQGYDSDTTPTYDVHTSPIEAFPDLFYYGFWFDLYPFGLVWQPGVNQAWRPYLYGHWIWTEWGWMWLSYEPWGDVTYHYGFWYDDEHWGWVWVPHYAWYPSAVDWVFYGDYIGWAPMAPPGHNVVDPWDPFGNDAWTVVEVDRMTSYDLPEIVSTSPRPRIDESATISRVPPHRDAVERRTGRVVPRVRVTLEDQRPDDATSRRVLLPENEMSKVKPYRQRAERDLITPEAKQRIEEEKRKIEEERTKKQKEENSKRGDQTRDAKEDTEDDAPKKERKEQEPPRE